MKRLVDQARALWLRPFERQVSSTPYDLFRIGLALLVLVRTSDVLRPIVDLDHHGWVHGLEYDPRVERVLSPALVSPLAKGLVFGPGVALKLVWARTLFAVGLLFGLRTRLCALLLAVCGGALLAVDRYRYLHHLYLMWLSVGWLALTPNLTRLSLERVLRRLPVPERLPGWPLALLKLQALVVYLAAGSAKLSAAWLSGKTLRELSELGLVGGSLWQAAVRAVGYGVLGVSTATIEIGIAILLMVRRTRSFGVAVGIAFHLMISKFMMVGIFSGLMILYLSLFPFLGGMISREFRALSLGVHFD